MGQTFDVCTGRSIKECETCNLGTNSEFVLRPRIYTDNHQKFGRPKDFGMHNDF